MWNAEPALARWGDHMVLLFSTGSAEVLRRRPKADVPARAALRRIFSTIASAPTTLSARRVRGRGCLTAQRPWMVDL
jgi:hypothetical protein